MDAAASLNAPSHVGDRSIIIDATLSSQYPFPRWFYSVCVAFHVRGQRTSVEALSVAAIVQQLQSEYRRGRETTRRRT